MAERRAALGLSAAAVGAAEAGVALSEIAHTGKLALRGRPDPAALAAAGVALPAAPCTAASTPAALTLWLGPDEWLLVTPPGAEAALLADLRRALAGQAAAVVDVTDSRTVIRVAGAWAGAVLAKGCALDTHRCAFADGAVKQSLVAGIDSVVHRASDGFELYVLRSFADHLWRWLADAGAEHGVAGED